MKNIIRGAGTRSIVTIYWRIPWPLSSISINPDSIKISIWPDQFLIKKENIISLEKHLWFWFPFLSITHTDSKIPNFLQFNPLKFSQLELILKENNYILINKAGLIKESRRKNFFLYIELIGVIVIVTSIVLEIKAYISRLF